MEVEESNQLNIKEKNPNKSKNNMKLQSKD